jgi:hypothetical protein
VKAEYHGTLNEYKKLLELRATRIHKLELQMREQVSSSNNSLTFLSIEMFSNRNKKLNVNWENK